MRDPEKLHELYGDTFETITPTGNRVVIRQQNGEDDDILSNSVDSKDGTSINKFCASLVVDSDINTGGQLSLGDVLQMKLCDKYYIIIASRIFSLGQILKFSFKWENLKSPVEYEEDLAKFIWDYSKDYFPYEPNHPEYFEQRIQPHKFKKETIRELTLKSGKKVKYTFMNGAGEKYLLRLPEELTSKNQEFLARDLCLWLDNKWIKVQNFKTFSPTDMSELRKELRENDPPNTLMSELENPETHDKVNYPIVGNNDFFFPREI
jgi:hypothetical protein